MSCTRLLVYCSNRLGIAYPSSSSSSGGKGAEEEDGVSNAECDDVGSTGSMSPSTSSMSLSSGTTSSSELGSNCSTSTTTTTTTKVVRFVQETQVKCSDIILSEEEIKQLWWKQRDYSYFRRNSARAAAFHATVAMPRLRNAYSRQCSNVGEDDVSQDIMRGTMETKDNDNASKSDVMIKELMYMSCADARGLETRTLPAISKNRRSAVRALVFTQTKLSAEELDRTMQEEMLAAVSLRMSSQSRHVAAAFGSADAMVARHLHRH